MNAPAPKSGWSSRQITTMVVAICAAVVLAPIGAIAATGSLVNITDPVYSARKARVDTSGRLTVADTAPESKILLQRIALNCGADGNGIPHVINTSGYSSIRVWAYNPGSASQAILDIYPVINGAAQYPPVFSRHLPYGSATIVNEVHATPPPTIDVRVTFCSPGFKLAVFGSR